MNVFDLDLANHKSKEVKFFSGRPRGEKVRESIFLGKKEDMVEEVRVKVPTGTRSIHTSFFLGLFGPSVRKCGSGEKFLEKFKFDCEEIINKDVDEGIVLALKKSNVLKEK